MTFEEATIRALPKIVVLTKPTVGSLVFLSASFEDGALYIMYSVAVRGAPSTLRAGASVDKATVERARAALDHRGLGGVAIDAMKRGAERDLAELAGQRS